jgi:two-component system sensor histidine kinase HydH
MAEQGVPPGAKVSPSMGELIRRLGHDLRNDFSVMKNAIYYLTLKGDGGDPKVSKHLGILEREVDQANNIIMDLMTYAWPKAPMYHDLKINRVLERALARADLPESVSRHSDFSPELGTVRGDEVQLQHAFTNLIQWAAQALPGAERVTVCSYVGDGHAVVNIAGAGRGMSPGFEAGRPGLDVGAPDSREGLALTVSNSLIEAHGGSLSVGQQDGGELIAQVKIPC